MVIHEFNGYSHTSLLAELLNKASMANPNMNIFATNTPMSEAGCPYIGTHLFGPRQFVIFSKQPPIE